MKLGLYTVVFAFFVGITGCNNNKKHVISEAEDISIKTTKRIISGTEDVPIKTITIQSSNITKEEIGNFLVLDSYIILSNKELFGEVKRVMMENDRIYICDQTHRIFCFDTKGTLIYVINRRGRGPEEYINIADFAVDGSSDKLFIYDDNFRRMLAFNKHTGEFISSFSTQYMLPLNFGMIDGHFYFNNDDDRRVVDKETQKFYLLYSETGKQIDRCFFPHNASAEYHFIGRAGHPFFYNDGNLLYNQWLDSRVYSLEKNRVVPLYDIMLPNPLPKKKIEEKMEHWDIVRSDYSYGISDIFLSESILYFTFSKEGFLLKCFYDTEKDKVLFCGTRGLVKAREKFLFDYLIKGVHEGKFFALVPPSRIIELIENNPNLFPKNLKDIQYDDNCVIAFYRGI